MDPPADPPLSLTPPAPHAGSQTSAPPPTDPVPSAPTPRRAHTILGRLSQAMREQNWFAVGLEVMIVVLGVVIGFQVTGWGQARSDVAKEQTYLRQLIADFAETERRIAAEDSARFARTLPAARRLLLSFGYDPKPPADSVLAWYPNAWRQGYTRPVLSTVNALVSSGNVDLIRDDSLRLAIITYLDLNEELMEEQRILYDIAEAAGQRIGQRVDISEWLFTTLPDSAREARARQPDDVGIYPTGEWSPPIPLDVDAFYADPAMYTSTWSLALTLGQIGDTHGEMRESAAALRERVEAHIEP